MLYDTKEFKLRDGRTGVLKNPGDEEAQALLDYLVKSAAETEFLLRYPEEWQRFTLEGEKRHLAGMKESGNDVFLTCMVDGKVAGNCHLMMNDSIKTRHRANIAIALLKEYWGLGIGTFMFQEVMKAGKEARPDLMQVELEVAEPNERGLALYKKMGFVEYGKRENALKCKDGTLMAEVLMMKKL